jgi:EmrB/QacA subfamily drug resistance transporter
MDSIRSRWLGLVFLSLAVSMVIVDITIVNVAIPAIIADLGISSTTAQWIQEAYTLAFAALLLTWGRVADRVGRRRMLVIGVIVFVVASVLAALAPNGWTLVLARLVQGVGGAMIFPCTLSLINATFTGRERGTAFAVWGSTIGGVAALGPLLGGWLTTELSWRWAFWINVPIGVAVVAGALTLVAESRDDRAASRLDPVGAVLSVLAAGLLVFGLIEGRTYGWWTTTGILSVGEVEWTARLSPVPVAFAGAAVAALAFVGWQLRRNRSGKPALLGLSLFAIPSFARGNAVVTIVSLGEFGILFVLPLWIQNVLGYSAFETGVLLLPLALGSFLAGGAAAAVATRRGPVLVVRWGLALEVIGIAGIGLVAAPDTEVWALVPFLATYGFGVGLASAQLPGVVLADVPVQRSGQASGTQSTAQEIGSAIGIAVLGTVLFTGLSANLTAALDDAGAPVEQREAVVEAVRDSAGAAIDGLATQPGGEAVADAANEAFSVGTRYASWTAAGFLLLGLAASISLRTATPQEPTAKQRPAAAEPAVTS